MKKSYVLVFILAAAVAAGCASRQNKQKSDTYANTPATLPVGADADEHGCKGSAGYTWSEVLGDCIRLFEKGAQCTSVTDPDSSLAAYVVFAADSTRAEAFIPGEKPVVLGRRAGAAIWEGAGPKSVVRDAGGKLTILDDGSKIYQQE